MTVIPIRRPVGDHLDRVGGLENTDSRNPAVIARQKLAAERTAFQIEHDPEYAADLARLRSYIADYTIPAPKEDS